MVESLNLGFVFYFEFEFCIFLSYHVTLRRVHG